MSRGGLKPETIVRKQVERAELARNATRLKHCGLTYRKIAAKLMCSPAFAHKLVHEGIDAYLAEAKQDAGEMIETIIADLLKSSQELWIQWERSKQDRRRIAKKTVPGPKGGKGNPEITETTETRCGDPRYLAEVRANMIEIARLRGVFSDDDDNEDPFKAYKDEFENSYESPPPEIIEDANQEQGTNGDGNANSCAGDTVE